jgi:hypothetical protein
MMDKVDWGNKEGKGSTILKLINVEVSIHECAPPTKLKICTFQT